MAVPGAVVIAMSVTVSVAACVVAVAARVELFRCRPWS
jgi:hypothetical protein